MKNQIKKNIKKQNEFTKQEELNTKNEQEAISIQVKKLFKILAGILGVLVLFFGLTILINGDYKDWGKDEEITDEPAYQEEIILGGQTFNRPEAEYYVLFKRSGCVDCAKVPDYFEDNELPLYTVDMNDGFNQNYLYDWDAHDEEYGDEDEEAKYNTNPSDVSELEIAYYPTLILIRDGKVVEFIDEDVIDYLDELYPIEENE